ncbi:TetR/AcrR family transcriptional regulator [Neobacillus thermocopriae]|uniref:TetR/AcrR family transcriptional regulator n=1 Tax=Neobacillus thermocopriae TaxID=1215031 RepID=A0A6B3TWE7_9BACI|nr:TetR/AcrR family transcriptional regulator [Neobacillus thermocopriae]MED3625274.1 TetR/AcrR family transcriptional regulator [Neobacillus thermocopriae]MED3714588.1 TetR/AcrR family transcriptional regulator [Neobacillus thermocopriae]NEX79947.1 TetR/AcrR family transcriptional regulator [Neobacillus thermocopriae]
MPKIVDHEKQKQIVAEAAIRVIKREGIEQATVRNIAKEANLSVGSLRHYFSTQSELYAFTMNFVSERVKQRIKRMNFDGPPIVVIKNLLKEFIPLNEETRVEMEVWLAFTTKALVDPYLQPLSEKVYEELKFVMSYIIEKLIQNGLTKPHINQDLETDRLYALIDGLAMHIIMHPDKISSDQVDLIIEHHLQTLCK